MTAEDSVTQWLTQLRDGDEDAARLLWHRFFTQMTACARRRMHGRSLPGVDDEDVALSAFNSFCMGFRRGRFEDLTNRDSLWRLLLVITARKASDQRAFHQRSKRDMKRSVSTEESMVMELVANEPSHEFTVDFADQLQALMGSLERQELRKAALLKMEGYSNSEIASQLGCSISTVERKLRTIRQIWAQEA